MYIVKSEVNESNKWSHRSYSSDRRSRVTEGRESFLDFSARSLSQAEGLGAKANQVMLARPTSSLVTTPIQYKTDQSIRRCSPSSIFLSFSL